MARIIITTSNNLIYDNRVHKITESLIKTGYEVWRTGRNWPPTPAKSDRRPGHTVLFNLPFHRGPLFYLFLNTYTLFFLLKWKFAAIWAVDMDTLPASRIAGFLKGKPVIFDSHEFFSESPEIQQRPQVKKFWRLLERIFIPGCSKRFTVSPGLVEIYQERYACQFELLRNLPLKKENPAIPLLSTSPPVILYQGSLNTGRGLAETIQAMQYLPGYKFVIVGQGDCTQQLKSLTSVLGLQDRVEFAGAVPFEELSRFHGNVLAGMCLLEKMGLSYYHSLPNRIFDYLQAGIPVIATAFPDISEIVKKYNTGMLLDDLEPQNIAAAIKEACENKALRQEWRKSIPAASLKFTWENEANKLNLPYT
ncbi:MAG: glycosyltransferase [Marinilabilia sp.]